MLRRDAQQTKQLQRERRKDSFFYKEQLRRSQALIV